MHISAGWVTLTVVLLLRSIRLPVTEAAPCGCSAEQQKASSLASLILNDTGNSSSSSSSGKQQATSTPAAPTASFVRIDDMLIPIEDLQPPPARSDGLGSAQASSSSNSNSLPPSSYVSCRGLWPGGVLYYRFSSSFPSSNRSFVRQSLANLEALVSSANNQKKLITFVEADFFFNVHYVNVVDNGDGCYSYLGRWSMDSSGKQDLSLEIPGCLSERTVQHEFMHALGFYHEHQRPDRDSYVTVQWSKIRSNRCSNFKRHKYQLPSDYPRYDYSSVMHYRSDSFGCDSSDLTIVMTNGSSIGLSNTSSLDVSKLSYTYSSKNLAYCNSASTTSTSEFSIRLLWMAQISIVTAFVLSIKPVTL